MTQSILLEDPAASSPRNVLARLVALVLALLLAVALGVAAGPMAPAHAEGKDDKVRRKQQIDQQIAQLRSDLSDVDKDLADTYVALAQTELEIPAAQDDLEAAQRQAEEARATDEEMGRRLESAQAELERLEGQVAQGDAEVNRSDEDIKRVALASYKGDGIPSAASVYLGSADPQQAVDRSMNYTLTLETQGAHLTSLRTGQALARNSEDRLDAVRQEVADLKEQAEAALKSKQDAQAAAEKAKTDLDALYAQQTQQKADLEVKKVQYQSQESALETQSSGLDQEIADLTRQEREAAQRGTPQFTVPSNGGGAGVSAKGFMRPVDGPTGSPFGWRIHPIYHYRKLHAGQDFPVSCGTPVRATQDGRVIETSFNSQAGNKLVISHGAMGGTIITSSYHHLSRYGASVGQTVKRGDVIAYVGTTGSSTGCHLHFEIHENGTAVDPTGYL